MAQVHEHGEINLDFDNHFDEEEEVAEEVAQMELMEPEAHVEVTAGTQNTSGTKSSSKSRSGSKKPLTKSQLVAALAARTGKPAKIIRQVLEAHEIVGVVQLQKTGQFRIPGLMTLKAQKKNAKPERMGYNPFTKQHQRLAAKPASFGVKARPDTKVKKSLKPKEKVIVWDAKARAKLEKRMNEMVIKKSMSKAQIVDHISHKAKLPRPDVAGVFDLMGELCVRELAARGQFKIPDVANLTVRERAAMPERQGINPFTKQPAVFKARAATKTVKSSVPKGLRSLASVFMDHKSYTASSCGSCPSKSSSSAFPRQMAHSEQ